MLYQLEKANLSMTVCAPQARTFAGPLMHTIFNLLTPISILLHLFHLTLLFHQAFLTHTDKTLTLRSAFQLPQASRLFFPPRLRASFGLPPPSWVLRFGIALATLSNKFPPTQLPIPIKIHIYAPTHIPWL